MSIQDNALLDCAGTDAMIVGAAAFATVDTTNMPALVEDIRPTPADNNHQERRIMQYLDMLYARMFAPVDYGVAHDNNRNMMAEEVN